jgi:hypothetical protein
MSLAALVDVLTSVKATGQGFQDLHPAFWNQTLFTRDFHQSLVRYHWTAAQFVPYCLDKDLCVEMLQQDVNAWSLVPHNLRPSTFAAVCASPSETAINLIMAHHDAVLYVPQRKLEETVKMCFTRDPYAVIEILSILPVNSRSEKICLEAVQRCGCDLIGVMQLVPEVNRTREVCRAFVDADVDSMFLEDLPQDLRADNVIYEFAVAGRAMLSQIPDCLRDQAVYEAAQFKDLHEIPERYRSTKVYVETVRMNWENFRNIPDHMLNDDLVHEAVCANWRALELIPNNMVNDQVVFAALRSDSLATAWVPPAYYGTEHFNDACRCLINRLHEVPKDRLTDQYLMAIVTADGRLLMEISKDRQTLDMCRQAYNSSTPPILTKFPRSKKSRHACVEAVRKDASILRYVPPGYLADKLEPNIYEIAIQVNPKSIQYVPHGHNEYARLSDLADQITQQRGIEMNDPNQQ